MLAHDHPIIKVTDCPLTLTWRIVYPGSCLKGHTVLSMQLMLYHSGKPHEGQLHLQESKATTRPCDLEPANAFRRLR